MRQAGLWPVLWVLCKQILSGLGQEFSDQSGKGKHPEVVGAGEPFGDPFHGALGDGASSFEFYLHGFFVAAKFPKGAHGQDSRQHQQIGQHEREDASADTVTDMDCLVAQYFVSLVCVDQPFGHVDPGDQDRGVVLHEAGIPPAHAQETIDPSHQGGLILGNDAESFVVIRKLGGELLER